MDKYLLKMAYCASLTNTDLIKSLEQVLQPAEIRQRLASLRWNKLVDKNNNITEKGKNCLKVVLTGGVFDLIHPGHINTLVAAKALSDVLVVVVARDDKISKNPRHNEQDRQMLASMQKPVDVCLLGQSNIFSTVKLVKPDIIALGYDQSHSEDSIKSGCEKIGQKINIMRLKSTNPSLSSSKMGKIDYKI